MLQALTGCGLLLVLHSAYSAVHYKSYMRGKGMTVEANTVPADVAVEVLIGFLMCLVGVTFNQGEFLPVKSSCSGDLKKYDTLDSRPEFEVFGHRGKYIATRGR